ncbi:MAG: PQQ-binding-like beta-propeller repeat protein [Chitinophagaceae bacterium]|nr:PQQ-binding-like beta-propeller repeat protein [Chitinophagaceae bacterium]
MKKLFTCVAFLCMFHVMPILAFTQVILDSAEWHNDAVNTIGTGTVSVGRLDTDCAGFSDSRYNNGLVVNAVGSTVYFRTAKRGNISGVPSNGGTLIASTFLTGTIENKPALVKLRDGKWYVFVTTTDGKLYKLNVTSGGIIATTGSMSQIVSIRRPGTSGCSVQDQIVASPVVQLEAESNSAYTLGEDIVMVATKHGCGSTTTNMVYAFDAADITQPPLWVFNQFGDYAMDFSENIVLDKSRNALFCVSHLTVGAFQNTLWRLNTVTGNLEWAADFNSIHSRPILGNPALGQLNHLYAVDMLGYLHAIDPETGVEDWNLHLSLVPGVYADLPVSLGEGAFAGQVLVTTTEGILYSVYDNGTLLDGGVEFLWTYKPCCSVKVKTSAAILGATGKCYVGQDDGTVHQINMATGANEKYSMAYFTVPPPATAPCAELEIYKADMRYKLVHTHWGPEGVIIQNNIPEFVESNHPDLNTWTGAIDSAWENPGNWQPNRVPTATTDVFIKCYTEITISSMATCRSMEIQPEAILTITPGFKLTVVH